MMHVFRRQDVWAGLLFLAIGGVGALYAAGLRFGTPARMGPGFFPMILSLLIIALGVVTVVRGALTAGLPVERFRLRPLGVVVVGILAVAFLLQRVGLVWSVFALVLLTSLARPERGVVQTLAIAVCLSAFSVLVFVYGLNFPVGVWWGR